MVQFEAPLAYAMQGVFFVCRKNQLLGGMLIAFGLGLLMGKCLEASFMSTFFGLAIVVGGVMVVRQK